MGREWLWDLDGVGAGLRGGEAARSCRTKCCLLGHVRPAMPLMNECTPAATSCHSHPRSPTPPPFPHNPPTYEPSAAAFVLAIYSACYCGWAFSWRLPRAEVAAARLRSGGARLLHDVAALGGMLWIAVQISFAW